MNFCKLSFESCNKMVLITIFFIGFLTTFNFLFFKDSFDGSNSCSIKNQIKDNVVYKTFSIDKLEKNNFQQIMSVDSYDGLDIPEDTLVNNRIKVSLKLNSFEIFKLHPFQNKFDGISFLDPPEYL